MTARVVAVSVALWSLLVAPTLGATFTVTTTANSGAGSLRDAIQLSNANGAVADTISFAAALGGKQIRLVSPLPALTAGNLTISGDLTNDGTPDIGLDGAALAGDGLQVRSAGNTIRGLRISRCGGAAIALDQLAAQNNRIEACFLGTDKTGSFGLGNNHGVLVTNGASANTIGGTTVTDRNVISGNHLAGILIAAANNTRVQGNFIGVDVSGALPLGNGAGVIISDSESCRIGNGAAGGRNVISANEEQVDIPGGVPAPSDAVAAVLPFESHGIFVLRGAGHVIAGNHIGTNAAGTEPLLNNRNDVQLRNAVGVLIGGATSGARNVIADEIEIEKSRSVSVQGNHVGLNAAGNALLGSSSGVDLRGATQCTVGGTSAGVRNVIVAGAFGLAAVSVQNGQDNSILGNFIGLSRNGTKVLGGGTGVQINQARNTQVGSTQAGSGNVIAGMTQTGINVFDAPGTRVSRNLVGALGNGDPAPLPASIAVHVQTTGGPVTIGGTSVALGNRIFVDDQRRGIAVNGPSNVQVLNNRIEGPVPEAVFDFSTGISVGVVSTGAAEPRIAGNVISGMARAIEISGAQSNPVVVRNELSHYSLAAITIENSAQANLGDLGNAPTNDDGANVFTHNFSNLDVQNLTANPIKAEGNNWFGATTKALIETFIFDDSDDGTKGAVDFDPIFGGLIPSAMAQAGGSAQLTGLAAVPTTAGAEITFSLSATGTVVGEILNIAGRPVALLGPQEAAAGLNRLSWNAHSAQGTRVPAGTYLVRLSARAETGVESNALTAVRIGQ